MIDFWCTIPTKNYKFKSNGLNVSNTKSNGIMTRRLLRDSHLIIHKRSPLIARNLIRILFSRVYVFESFKISFNDVIVLRVYLEWNKKKMR